MTGKAGAATTLIYEGPTSRRPVLSIPEGRTLVRLFGGCLWHVEQTGVPWRDAEKVAVALPDVEWGVTHSAAPHPHDVDVAVAMHKRQALAWRRATGGRIVQWHRSTRQWSAAPAPEETP